MIEIVLATVNQVYMYRFSRYVRTSHWNDKVRLHLFTNGESLQAFLTAEHSGYLFVLLDEEISEQCERFNDLQDFHSYRLVKKVLSAQQEIRMYQPVSQIMQSLYDIYVEDTMENPSVDRKHHGLCKITAVVSPYGGSGVTTIAFALARAYALRDEKVLYVNLELYPKPYIVPDCKYDFSRLLYMLTTRPEELDHKWQLYCAPHEPSSVYCFRPPPIRRDLRDLKSEHLHLLLDKFRQFGFHKIVLDADAHWLDDLYEQHIEHDECWVVVPWKLRELRDFPELTTFISNRGAKLIFNQVHTSEYASLKEIDEKADVVIPYIHSETNNPTAFLMNEQIPSQLSRMFADPTLLGVGGEY